MPFRLLKLIKISRFLMFHVKQVAYMAYNRHHKSIHKLHLLVAFFLLAFFSISFASTEAQAEEKLTIEKLTLNGDKLSEVSPGVYSGTVSGGPSLNLNIAANFDKLTDYHLKASITFTYPQSVSGSYVNITPYRTTIKEGTSYLAEIGKISSNNRPLTYHKRAYYDENKQHIAPFHHGGYLSAPFGGSASTQKIDTDLTYYFGEDESATYIGLLFESGGGGALTNFASMARQVTVTIDYLTPVERATIENAETTKNIFEWLQSGLVNLFVPTSDGFQEMVQTVNTRLQAESGILTLPLSFASQCVANLLSALSGQFSAIVQLPKFQIELNGVNHILWNNQTFNLNTGLVQHLFSNSDFVSLVQMGTGIFIFIALIKTGKEITLGLLDIKDLTQTFEEEEN